jgi:hypothetical protein
MAAPNFAGVELGSHQVAEQAIWLPDYWPIV